MARYLALLSFLAITTQAFAGNHYVNAKTGSDSGDGSQSRPWRTVTHAMAKVSGPGDVLFIAAGEYDATLGEAPEISLKPGVMLVGVAPWVTNIRATLLSDGLTKAPSVQNLLFNTMKVKASGITTGFDVTNCVMDHGEIWSDIELDQGAVFNPHITSTRIQGHGKRFFWMSLDHGSKVGGSVTGCDTYLGMDGGHEFDIWLSRGSELATTFIGNLFHMKRRLGICFYVGYLEIEPKNVFSSLFVNNTFTFAAFHMMEGIDLRPTYYNNILSQDSGFWLLTKDRVFSNDICDGLFNGVNGNFAKPPRFVNEDKDFRLLHDSPCIDAGRNDAPQLGVSDRSGVPRVLDGNLDSVPVVDVGSQEFTFGTLSASGTPEPGGNITYHVDGISPFGGLLFLGDQPAVIDLGIFGDLLFDPSAKVRPMFIGWLPADATFTIPNDPHLSGSVLYAQVLSIMPCLCAGTLSNRVDLLIE